MEATYIIDAVRTPVGKYGGVLSSIRPDDLLAITIKGLLERNADIDINCIDGVIAGDGNQAGEDCRNVARMAAILAGLPFSVTGNTVNSLCGSGMQAVIDASRAIACGDGQLYISAGVESMSRAPMVMHKDVYAGEKKEIIDSTIGWRFTNSDLLNYINPNSMGQTAEIIAKKYGVSRVEQDEFALYSHKKYFAALAAGKWNNEIIKVPVKTGETINFIDTDEPPRQLTIEQLARLKPIFDTSLNGTVTAGNSSGINDGAAALLLANESMVKTFDLKPKARIVATEIVGVYPDEMGIGGVKAVNRLLKKTGLSVADIDLWEMNESFSATSIVADNLLGLDASKVNINGGSLAIGHAVGSTGARIITTLLHELSSSNKKRGIASIGVGLGLGMAVMIER